MITIETIQESLAKARRLIETGEQTNDLWLLEMKDEVYTTESQRAEFTGCCSVGCSPNNIVQSFIGPVCKWTRQPCEAAKLRNLIELLGSINRNQTPSLLEGIHCDHHLSR